MKKNKIEPDFQSLIEGIVLEEEKEQKTADLNIDIQTLAQLCTRMESYIQTYNSIEQRLNNDLAGLKASVQEMESIRNSIAAVKDEKIHSTVQVYLKDADGVLTRFEERIRQCTEEGAVKCGNVVNEVACQLKSLLIGRTNDMEPVLISSKTRHWITTTAVLSYLVVIGILAIIICLKSGKF